MHRLQTIATKSFHKKLGGNKKLNVKHSRSYKYGLDKMLILSTISTVHPLISWFLLIPKQINFDASYRTCSFWKIYSPLLIDWIRGYTSIIWCKTNLWFICLTPKWNESCKKICWKILSSKTWGELKPLCFCQKMRTKWTE